MFTSVIAPSICCCTRIPSVNRAAQPRPRVAWTLQRRLPQRRRAGAGHAVVEAAQKQVYTSFHDMILQSKEPVLVDFHATWCGPCQMMGNILAEVAPALRGRVKVVKVDTEKYPLVASQYQIGALPTLILFKDGKPVDRVEGVLTARDLHNRLEYFLR